MKKNLYLLITLLICFNSYWSKAAINFSSSGCSLAGTASLQTDSICYEDTTVLNLTGYIGTIQWQSFDGTNWINETGTGSTTDAYQVVPGVTMQYRAVVTNAACPADTSNIISITVGTIPVPSGVGATRCGPGQVTLTGTGSGTLQWYTDSVGGLIIGTGSPFDAYVAGTTTLYLSDNTASGSGASPIMITELDFNDNPSGGAGDDIEIQNVASFPVDVTGWKVVAGDIPGDINQYNSIINTLSGVMQPGDIISYTDVAGPNFWGQNIVWNNGQNSWVMLLDSNYVIKDVVVTDWDSTSITTMAPVINGFVATVGTHWSGAGVNSSTAGTGEGVVRNGNLDNNNNVDFSTATLTINTTNPTMTLPFLGLGCSSPRIPIDVTVTFSDPVTITADPPALCEGQTSTLIVSSTNTNYVYTWSPDTALSSTTGDTIIASPGSPVTYIVIGDDGTCSNRDTVFIDVGPQSQAGTASSSIDTICLGNTAILSLTGTVGTIQWQSDTGTGWINETGPGSDSTTFIVSPTTSIQYQAVVTNGGCESDTSVILPVTVLTVTDPLVNDTTGVCANDTISLTATGAGVIDWFSSSIGGASLYTGNPFTTFIIGDTTFYAQAKGGSTSHVGLPTIGSSNQSAVDGYGLQFDVARLCLLEKVYVYPYVTGNVVINLRTFQGGPILETVTQSVTTPGVKTAIGLGWSLSPGTGYRLEISGTSLLLRYNYNGAVYPYASPGSPVTIIGYLEPFLNTSGVVYYYFYDWVVFEGCTSNRVPLNITTTPPQPIIIQNGTTLTSSASSGNQWYLNGNLLTGATSQTLTISQVGIYSVHVTVGGCTAIGTISVTTIGIDELQAGGISIYPNPVAEKLSIDFNTLKNNVQVRLSQATGAIVFERMELKNISNLDVDMKQFETGVYLLEIKINDDVYRKTLVKN